MVTWFNVKLPAIATCLLLVAHLLEVHAQGPAGECPPPSLLECGPADLASNCWSPGSEDIDCPGRGLCCHNGCANICLEVVSTPPALAPSAYAPSASAPSPSAPSSPALPAHLPPASANPTSGSAPPVSVPLSPASSQPPPSPYKTVTTGKCPPPSLHYCSPADLAPNCWSPGFEDVDCPGHGLCCHNGCANVCLEGPATPPAYAPPAHTYAPPAAPPSTYPPPAVEYKHPHPPKYKKPVPARSYSSRPIPPPEVEVRQPSPSHKYQKPAHLKKSYSPSRSYSKPLTSSKPSAPTRWKPSTYSRSSAHEHPSSTTFKKHVSSHKKPASSPHHEKSNTRRPSSYHPKRPTSYRRGFGHVDGLGQSSGHWLGHHEGQFQGHEFDHGFDHPGNRGFGGSSEVFHHQRPASYGGQVRSRKLFKDSRYKRDVEETSLGPKCYEVEEIVTRIVCDEAEEGQ